mgnify:CR=1 FL=1
MAKNAGRNFLIKKNSVTLAGGKTTTMKVSGSPINVETATDAGVQVLLDGIVTGKSIELSFEGYEDGNVLRDIALGADADKFMTDLTLSFPDGDTLACDFFMSEYEETGEMEDGVTFTATFMSNGAHTHTAA